MGTEARNPRSIGLDKMTPQEIVRLMNEEEHQVIRAMKAAEPQLAEAITQCAEVYNGGGRIVYVGAGLRGGGYQWPCGPHGRRRDAADLRD